MNVIYPVYVALAAVVLFAVLPWRRRAANVINILISLLVLILTLWAVKDPVIPDRIKVFVYWNKVVRFIYLFIGIFAFLFAVYNTAYLKEKNRRYYIWYYLTIFASMSVILLNHWVLLIIFWSISGIGLYMLAQTNDTAAEAANKSIILFGVGDGFLVLAVALIYIQTHSFYMNTLNSFAPAIFIFLLITAFTKAGVFPLHTWVPDFGSQAPAPATALLPGAMDKFLGIYLLYRIFVLSNPPQSYRLAIMFIGGLTIIIAVYMALRQHGAKRLLSYHIVSQVGYMVVGIATGTAVGIAGALFHMLNNTIYKSALILGVGFVEKETGTDQLEKLGGLSKTYPLTFVSMLIAALSISGIPPFNGFYSKWLIYQSLVNALRGSYPFIVVLVLLAALFGSALTLASFVKLIHSIFLGGRIAKKSGTKEPFGIVAPQLVLAALCIILGLWAYALFVGPIFGTVPLIGVWNPALTGVFYTAGIVVGLILIFLNSVKIRRDVGFIGGEVKSEAMKMSGVEFYTSIENIRPFKLLYFLAEKKVFDVYYIGRDIVYYFKRILAFLHSGLISNYIAWVFLGLIIIFVLGGK